MKQEEQAEQAEAAEAAEGQNRAETAGTLGLFVLGIALGLQILYAAFSLFGEKIVRPADLQTFTKYGRALYRPEREIPLYLIGCLLTALLVIRLHREWQKRVNLVLPNERAVFALAHGVENVFLALTSTVCFFCVIYVQRKALHRLPLSLAALLLYFAAVTAVVAYLWTRSRSLFTAFARGWLTNLSPHADTARMPADTAAQTAVTKGSRNNRFWDIAVPVALFLMIWVPNTHRQAGFGYTIDHFHHWDYFVMAPTVGYMHGGALGTQIYTQYGMGWPLLFAFLTPVLPLSYGSLILASMAYTLLYYIGVYACLRYFFRDGKWAAGGVFLAFTLTFYMSSANQNAWVTPSSMCLRSPCDIWLFFALLLHTRTRRTSALYLASLLTGLALLFETDTGIYLSAAFGLYLLLSGFPVRPGDKSAAGETSATTKMYDMKVRESGRSRLGWPTCAVCGGIVLAVLVTGLWIGSRGTLLQPGFVAGWLEVLWLYPSGISLLPVYCSRIGAFASFLFIGVYLGVGVWLVICRQARQAVAYEGWLWSLLVFGLLYMLQFIGRSYSLTPFNVSLPFSLLLIIGIKAFAETFLSGTQTDRQKTVNLAANPSLNPSLAMCGWALAGILLLGINPIFRRYPSLLLAFGRSLPPATRELLPAAHDVLLPDAYAEEIRQFAQTAQEIHGLTVQGRRVAILSNDDTSLYLASGTPLWCRYSPVIASILTRTQQEQLASQLAAPTTDYVYILQHDPMPDTPIHLATTDTWNHLRDVLTARYRYDHVCGKYEVWRR